MDEQEHSASPQTPAAGGPGPATGPAPETAGPAPERRGDGVRDVLTSRGAGWAVAAAMAGAVAGLSVAMATSSSPTVVVQPDGVAGPRGAPAGAARAALPTGALRAMASGGRVQAQAPARLRIQIPATSPLRVPARLRVQLPAAGPLQAPARLRLVPPVPGPAGTLIPLPGAAAPVLPGRQVIASGTARRAVRLRVRPGQVRVRLRVPANGRFQVLPAGQMPGPLRVVPGQRPAALVPAPARLRIVFRTSTPVPARLLIPARVPGQARLRIQVPARARIRVPARARIQVPTRARITPALPAPPNW